MSNNPAVSVIIPALYEADRINDTIEHIKEIDRAHDCEIVVVDGDPERSTIGVIDDDQVATLVAVKGRAVQMNAGATASRGSILLFLHADTRLPDNAIACVRNALGDGTFVGGAFGFAYNSDRWILRVFGYLSSLRCRMTRVPFGDQAIFVDRDFFFHAGRFKEIPLMEDLEFVRRIKRCGGRLRILRECVRTSPRRVEEEGTFYSGVRCAVLVLLYTIGVSPERLKRYYPDRAGGRDRMPHREQSSVSSRVGGRQRV